MNRGKKLALVTSSLGAATSVGTTFMYISVGTPVILAVSLGGVAAGSVGGYITGLHYFEGDSQ